MKYRGYELEYYQLENNMDNGIFKLGWANIKSALVYGVIWAIIVVIVQIQEVGSIWNLNWRTLLDTGIFAFLGFIITILRNLFTTNSGKFLGIKVIPETK